ncbi:phage major capsid protein [Rhodovulum sp. DZ06]|uniref:phage major capsid protein n=1 Tax=Rhodovulum sp. DZ06 TaxID=3425126 RepID=UPI003D3524AC
MKTSIRDLKRKRASLLDEAEALIASAEAETRDLSEAEQPEYEKRMAEVQRIDRQIEIAKGRETGERAAEARSLGDADAAKAEFRAILRGETRAMEAGTDADGGFAVPEQIDRMIQAQLLDVSLMRRVATVVSTATTDWKKLINTRGASSGWAGETDARAETATPQLAQIAPPTGELYAYPWVTNHLLQDAFFDPEAFLSENVLDEFAMQEGAAFLTGDGADKPKGLMTYPTAATADAGRAFGTMEHMVAGAAAAVTPDELVDLIYKVRAPYRQGAGVAWMMNSATVSKIRKLKDADGRFIWSDSLTEGQPARLLGYPVIEAEDMPDMAADGLPIAFGNFRRGYTITDRMGMTVIRDNVTKPGWTKLYFAKRVGGALTDSNAVKFLKMAAA